MATETQQKTVRDAKGLFVKGKSGNPGGRKPMPADFKAACQEKGSALLLQYLDSALKGGLDANLGIKIVNEALDRGYGKPTQATENVNYNYNDLTSEQVQVRIEELLAKRDAV